MSLPQKIAIMGASSVFGKASANGGFVHLVRKWHEAQNPEKNNLFNLGIPGETSQEMLRRASRELTAREIELVMVMWSSNDCVLMEDTGKPVMEFDEYRSNLKRMVEIAQGAEAQLVFLSAFPINEEKTNPFSDSGKCFGMERLGNLVDILKTYCEETSTPLINFFTYFSNSSEMDFISDDGLHCNDHGHEQMAKLVIDYLSEHF